MKLIIFGLILFSVGIGIFNNTEYKTFGGYLTLGTTSWLLYLIVMRPIIYLIKKIFRKTPAKEKLELNTNKQVPTDSSPKIDLKAKLKNNEKTERHFMQHLIPAHNLLVVSISKSVSEKADIYNAARYAWKLNVDRARQADYVIAHKSGEVIGVFEVDEWLNATDVAFNGMGDADNSRWGFEGRVAPSEVLMQYFGKQLPEGFIKRGASNPVRFIFLDDNEKTIDKASNISKLAKSIEHVTLATVDSSGEFSAVVEIQTSDFGDDTDTVYVEADITVEINGKAEQELVCENIEIGDGPIEINSGYIEVPKNVDLKYSVTGKVDMVKFSPPNLTDLSIPSNDGDIDIKTEMNGVKVTSMRGEWDEDSYKITFKTKGSAPYGVSTAICSEDEEPYPSYNISYENESEYEEIIFDTKAGDKVKLVMNFSESIGFGIDISSKGTAEDYRPDGDDLDESYDDAKETSESSTEFDQSFSGSVCAITVQNVSSAVDCDWVSASNGSLDGPLQTFYAVYNSDEDDYYLIIQGESIFLASNDEYGFEALKYALKNVESLLQKELKLKDEEIDSLLFYLEANITDEAEDIDDSAFTHELSEGGQVNSEDYFATASDMENRIWVSTSQSLNYGDITLNENEKTFDFDFDLLDEREVVSWSTFKTEENT